MIGDTSLLDKYARADDLFDETTQRRQQNGYTINYDNKADVHVDDLGQLTAHIALLICFQAVVLP